MSKILEYLFPGLATSRYRVTSPRDGHYNCIAWAAGDTADWWWPGPNADVEYWPPNVPRELTILAFQLVFANLNYVVCLDEIMEAGFEKIAIYAHATGIPTHAARQLPNGYWTSKLGYSEDIEHELSGLEGTIYGQVVLFMKRPITS